MRIGILTYHRADNFGAVLQAFALMQYLWQKGHEVEIIDYRCKTLESQYDVFNPRILLSRKNVLFSFIQYIKRFKNIRDRREKNAKFEAFRRRYLAMSRSFFSVREPLNYDVIITGSDQVWNFHLNSGSEKIYLLDFPCHPQTLRVAYAASSDCNGLNRIGQGALVKALGQMDKISVRESFLKEALAPLTDKQILECLDPTFLLPQSIIQKMVARVKKEPYILVFHMTPVTHFVPFIESIAKEKHAEVVEVFGGFQVQSSLNKLCNWGPIELLSLIAFAEKVFTTSFHGLSLSLIMHKDVWVINKGDNLRQRNLLTLVGLENRLLNIPEDYHEDMIDYGKVERNLMPALEQSKKFLDFQ